jgi:hypothetical protein
VTLDWLGSCLTRQKKRLAREKRSSLLVGGVADVEKPFYRVGPTRKRQRSMFNLHIGRSSRNLSKNGHKEER